MTPAVTRKSKTLRGLYPAQGMGKLGGALEAGAELSYQLDLPPMSRDAGDAQTQLRRGRADHTAYVESGLTGQYPLPANS